MAIMTAVGGYITNGPECSCGKRDWFIKDAYAICSACERKRQGKVQDVILEGPECYCGHRDWFVMETSYRCAHCDRERS